MPNPNHASDRAGPPSSSATGASEPDAAAPPPAPEPPIAATSRARRLAALGLPLLLLVAVIGWYAATDWRMFRRSFEAPRSGYCATRMTRATLDESLRLGTQYLLAHQREEGNFDYEFDWIRGTYSKEDRQVRQAGALWALSLLHREQPDEALAKGIARGIGFYRTHTVVGPEGDRCIAYPGQPLGLTGTVAVAALAILDGLPAGDERISLAQSRWQQQLDGYVDFLVRARDPSGVFYCCYETPPCRPHGKHSPYSDGEALLALVKAAKRLDRPELEPIVRQAAADGHRVNVTEALAKDRDSDTTKGYYQWSSMAFYELYTSGWADTERYGDWVLELADWMVDVHNPLSRSRNTAYSIEGIAHAYDVARRRGDAKRQQKYGCVIDTVLEQLTSWQVGSPLANRFIASHPTSDPLALGGVQNEPRDSKLRIDVTQHQMHAVLLARRFVYLP